VNACAKVVLRLNDDVIEFKFINSPPRNEELVAPLDYDLDNDRATVDS